jgi:tRNA(Ile)-lysidine synthase
MLLFNVDDFSGAECIIVAVSGGSDSLALLFLLREYFIYSACEKRMIAITVDHALRPESKDEAKYVARLCKSYEIFHEIVVWNGKKPRSSISSIARIARYELLCKAAEKYGANVIVTGHTLDDQAETYIMRSLRRSRRGLAVMPRVALLQEKFCLLRPLLEVRRLTLQSYLRERKILWIQDPTNDNPSYERVRIRKYIDEYALIYADYAVSFAAQRRRSESERVAALALKLRMSFLRDQLLFDLSLIKSADLEDFVVLIAMSAAIMGGREYPSTNRRSLLEFLSKRNSFLRRMTLSGAMIEMTKNFVRIWREKRNLKSLIVKSAKTAIWDGRYHIINKSDKAVLLRSPNKVELMDILRFLDIEDVHFSSLETTCMVCGSSGFDFPVLRVLNNKNIEIQRIMLPFNRVVSSYDFVMFWVFRIAFSKNR